MFDFSNMDQEHFEKSIEQNERQEQIDRILQKLAAMTPEQLREFVDHVKQQRPDIYKDVFAETFDK